MNDGPAEAEEVEVVDPARSLNKMLDEPEDVSFDEEPA